MDLHSILHLMSFQKKSYVIIEIIMMIRHLDPVYMGFVYLIKFGKESEYPQISVTFYSKGSLCSLIIIMCNGTMIQISRGPGLSRVFVFI